MPPNVCADSKKSISPFRSYKQQLTQWHRLLFDSCAKKCSLGSTQIPLHEYSASSRRVLLELTPSDAPESRKKPPVAPPYQFRTKRSCPSCEVIAHPRNSARAGRPSSEPVESRRLPSSRWARGRELACIADIAVENVVVSVAIEHRNVDAAVL